MAAREMTLGMAGVGGGDGCGLRVVVGSVGSLAAAAAAISNARAKSVGAPSAQTSIPPASLSPPFNPFNPTLPALATMADEENTNTPVRATFSGVDRAEGELGGRRSGRPPAQQLVQPTWPSSPGCSAGPPTSRILLRCSRRLAPSSRAAGLSLALSKRSGSVDRPGPSCRLQLNFFSPLAPRPASLRCWRPCCEWLGLDGGLRGGEQTIRAEQSADHWLSLLPPCCSCACPLAPSMPSRARANTLPSSLPAVPSPGGRPPVRARAQAHRAGRRHDRRGGRRRHLQDVRHSSAQLQMTAT